MARELDGFMHESSFNTGKDGFPGTSIELGMWNNKYVALKYGLKQMHKKEAEIMAKIGFHPNVLQLEKQYQEGDIFIVLEGIKNGSNLEDFLDKKTKLSLDTCVAWLLQIALGLQHIHSRGIIHHDFKSANILLSSLGKEKNSKKGFIWDCVTLKICDFELSVDGDFGLKEQGSLRWMAPEVKYNSEFPITNKIDIYAFGLLFIDMIFCGRDAQCVQFLCPMKIFDLMYQCIDNDPNKRPTLDSIIETLSLSNFGPSVLGKLEIDLDILEQNCIQSNNNNTHTHNNTHNNHSNNKDNNTNYDQIQSMKTKLNTITEHYRNQEF